jgi:branched-chain amino acid aminotransferase
VDSPLMEHAFFQGRIIPFADARISIGTHSVQYGTGAFAGIRGYLDDDGQAINIFRLPDHAQRLLNSGRLLRAELPFDRDSLARTIVSLVERNAPKGDVYIRPFIYKPAVQLTPRLRGLGDELAIYMLAMGDYLKLDRGQRAIVSSWYRIPDNAIPSRGKLIGAYVNSALAKDEAEEQGADEAIMLNTAGKVAEGSGCNLFVVRNDTLITPPITGDILEGITRRSMLRMASDAGIRTEEREIDRTELYVADEAFFCGTGVQVAWIESVDGRPVGQGQMGPITTQLRTAFFDTVRGRSRRYADWITCVRTRALAAEPATARR